MPTIEFKDGTKIGSTNALVRMLGAKHGYYPEDPVCAYKNDFLMDLYADFFDKMFGPCFKSPEEAAAMCDDLFQNTVCKLLGYLEEFAAKGQFMVGPKLCCADFWIGGLYVNWMDNPDMCYGKEKWAEMKKKFPCFCAYGERFKAENAKYLNERPKRPM